MLSYSSPFGSVNYYAFPTHNRLKDGVTNIAERFACTGRTENEGCFGFLWCSQANKQPLASFGILTEDNSTSVVDVADFVLLFRFFADIHSAVPYVPLLE